MTVHFAYCKNCGGRLQITLIIAEIKNFKHKGLSEHLGNVQHIELLKHFCQCFEV